MGKLGKAGAVEVKGKVSGLAEVSLKRFGQGFHGSFEKSPGSLLDVIGGIDGLVYGRRNADEGQGAPLDGYADAFAGGEINLETLVAPLAKVYLLGDGSEGGGRFVLVGDKKNGGKGDGVILLVASPQEKPYWHPQVEARGVGILEQGGEIGKKFFRLAKERLPFAGFRIGGFFQDFT